MEALEGATMRPRQVRYQAALRPAETAGMGACPAIINDG